MNKTEVRALADRLNRSRAAASRDENPEAFLRGINEAVRMIDGMLYDTRSDHSRAHFHTICGVPYGATAMTPETAAPERRKDWRCTGCGHVNYTVRKPRRCIAFADCAGKLERLKQ